MGYFRPIQGPSGNLSSETESTDSLGTAAFYWDLKQETI